MANSIKNIRDKLSRQTLIATKRVAQEARSLGRDRTEKRVIFVAGVQRSGTNMMMDVLERHLHTDVFHESDPRAFDNYEMRPRETIHALVDGSRADILVIKSLCELQELRSLLDEFMPAQAVWMVRNFRDMINSHLKKFKGCPDRIRRIAFEGDSVDWRGRGISDKTLGILRDYYRDDINDASAVALFWYLRNVQFFEQGLDGDPRIRTIVYEALASAPQDVLPEIFAFLGLDYDPKIASYIFASSVGKDTPPKIDPPIAALCEELTARFAAISET